MTPPQASPSTTAESIPDTTTGFPPQVARYLPAHRIAQLDDPATRPAIAAHLSDLLHTVTTYLPRCLVRALLANPVPGQVQGEQVTGTLLFADLSGFTALSAALSQQGLAGAEQLVSIVNAIFTTMLGIIEREEGDLLAFGGDALLALFAEEGHPLAAMRAARAMQQTMGLFAQIETETGLFPMSMHIGVNSGEFLAASVGQPHAMQYVLLGRAVEDTARAESLAGSGEIVAGAATAAEIVLPGAWHPLDGPWFRLDTHASLPPVGRKKTAPPALDSTAVVTALDTLVPYLPAGLLERLVPYPAEPTVEADLKPVAVLFANLLGLEAPSASLGPQRLDEAVALLQERIAAIQGAVERCGGTLNKVTLSPQGVNLLVLFGAPSKHEDDPARAVHAALEMQAAVEETGGLGSGIQEPAGPPISSNVPAPDSQSPLPHLQLRVGMHTGDVFAGNVGSSWRKEYTVMGTTVNLAARLMGAAKPGQVWATAALYDRVGRGCQGEGPHEIRVKGWGEPLQVYRILDLQATRRAGNAGPLVGRQAEMALLEGSLAEIGQGHGRLISLVGEAGLGKSRLVEEVVAIARARGVEVRVGHTPSYGERVPYAPWNEVLRAGLGWTADMPADARAARLHARLAALSPELGAWAPVVAEALGLSMPETEQMAGLAPKLRRQRFFDLSLQLLQADAAACPLLIVLEDLHWAGPLTSELLTYMGRNIARSPVVILSTFRPVQAAFPWQDLPHHQTVELEPLPPERCHELVSALTDCPTLDPALAALIWERAQGNPLFIEEIVQVLEERGILARRDGHLQLQGSADQARQEIPPTVQEVILSRIDHLPEGMRSVLRVAAVIDPEFLFAVLVSIFPHHDPEAVLRERVEQLCQAGMLAPAGPDSYVFHHTLTREVAYQSIPHARRRGLHERVAHYYEEHFADRLEQYYGFLAHHYRHSADQPKAVEYALKAGRQAAHSYANEAAATYFQQALELEENSPGLLPSREKVQVRRERGDVLRQAGRFADALACYEQALQEGEDILSDSETAELYRLCGQVHEHCGRYEESLDALQQAHRVLLRLPEGPASLAMAHVLTAMSGTHWRTGAYDKAALVGEEALAIAEHALPGRERSSLMGQIYGQLGNAAATSGRYQEARTFFETGLRFREEAGQRPEIAVTYNNLGYLWHLQDEYQQAIDSYLRCLEVARQVGDPYIAAYAANNLGSAWYELGDYALAMEYCQESLAVRERIGDQAGTASCWDTMGLIHTALGEHGRALELHGRSLTLKQALGDTFQEANSLINLARTRYAWGELTEALSRSGEALHLLQELGTQALQAEAHAVAAEILLSLGRIEEARQHADLAMQAATAIGGRKDRAVAARVRAETLVADASADLQEAEQLFQQSIEALATLGCRLEWARACRSYGLFLLARGQDSAAQVHMEQAARLLAEIGVSNIDHGGT